MTIQTQLSIRDEWIEHYLNRNGTDLLDLASSNGYETVGLTYRQIAENLADETIRLTNEANTAIDAQASR